MHHRGRKLMAWLLTASVVLSGNSVTALAGELDFSDVQVAEEQASTVAGTDENEDLVTEISVQQEEPAEMSAVGKEEFGSEEVDLTMENEDTDETELETEDPVDNETDADLNVEEEDLFSAGDSEESNYENYYFPNDEVILPGWGRHVDRFYDGDLENADNQERTEIQTEVTNVSVVNAEGETDNTPVCIIEYENENGWDIYAERPGIAVVTLTYKDTYGKEKTYTYHLSVSTDKYTLEPQLTASCGRMLPDSEMKIPVVLRHEWRYSDEEEGSEEVKDWTLEFEPDENGWTYDTNLLPKVEINGHEITIASGKGAWGTDILLKAVIPLEDGTYEDVTSGNIHIEVCDEYDILYPENISNINLGDTLDLNKLDLRVEHINEDGSTSARNDVTYKFEYDSENNWKNTAAEGQLPILTRVSTDGTWLNIIAIDEEGNELDRREYRFDWIDYSVWFDDLREDDYMTYAFENEQYEISLNTQNLKKKNAEIVWNVICRQNSEDENYDQIPVPSEYTFWSVDEKNTSKITVDASKLKTAYEWLYSDENLGESYWFEVQASVKCGNIDLDSRAALGLSQVRKEIEDYDNWFPVKDQSILISDKIWISKEFNVWIENAENPNGAFILTEITGVEPLSEGKFECSNKGGGWMLRPLQPGEAEFKITYKKLNDETADQVVRIDVTGKVYGMDLSFEDNNNQVLAGETKTVDVAVSYRDEEHPDGERISDSKYSLNVETDVVYGAELVGNLTFNQKTSKIEVKTNSAGEADSIVVKVKLTLYTKDDNETPIWETEEEFGIYVTTEYEDVVELTNVMFDIPDIGDSFDIMECGVALKRYDGETKSWNEVNENIRFRLEYDEEVWTPTEEAKDDLVPVLIRNKGEYTVLRLIAEEQSYNPTYGREQWNEVSSRYIAVGEALCKHRWTITDEEPANCINTGKRYEKCEICEKEKEETIPANGIHTPGEWKVTKAATCSVEGEKTTYCTVCDTVITAKTDKDPTAHSYEWKTDTSATCGADGSRHEECKYCGSKGKTEKLSATGAHVLGEWTVTRAATAVAEGTRERHCTVCGGAKETGSVEKLKPSMILNVPTSKKLPLKVKQSFQVTASDFATGDRVISWTSSNKKIVTVSGNGKITGKKAGQAVVTVTLQSGLSAKFTVKVQKTMVTTTSLLVVNKTTGEKLPKTVSMKAKQKLTLQTSVTPVTSKQKVTYSSSDKKIATVNSKGVITAKKKGTVTITVKSGKKSVKIKVKVTK